MKKRVAVAVDSDYKNFTVYTTCVFDSPGKYF